MQITAEATTRPISLLQWQRFRQLLLESQFQQLTSYKESGAMDGAYWLLEAHQASGYHVVFRHSPDKTEGFRKACEYLLDLSSARREERYQTLHEVKRENEVGCGASLRCPLVAPARRLRQRSVGCGA